MQTAVRRLVLLVVLVGSLVGIVPSARLVIADGAAGRPVAAADTVPDTLPEANVYMPEERDLSDCLSSLPKPDCGSESNGGTAQLLTFGVLMLGMAFIGWRIFRSVRHRDRTQAP